MNRITLAAAAACAVVAALTGCAAATPAGPATATTRPVSGTVTPTPPVDGITTPTPKPSETAVADPKAVEPTTIPGPTVSALAQHIYDECSKGAADAGVTLKLTENPSGYTSNGKYELIYPFTFNDDHNDPYAIYNCVLTDNTVNSTYVGGGLSDSH